MESISNIARCQCPINGDTSSVVDRAVEAFSLVKVQPTMYQIPIVKVKLVRDTSQRSEQKIVNSPRIAAEVVRNYIDAADREHLVVILLDKQNKMIGLHTVSVGAMDHTIAAPREIFKAAILANAFAIVMAHNHPNDKVDPSPDDRQRVREVAESGRLLGITLMDAVIVCFQNENFYSFKERSPYDLG